MHEVKLNMSDKAFDSLYHIIQYSPDIDIVEDLQKPDNNDFKIDTDELVQIAKKIKNGDTTDFEATTPKQLIEEITQAMDKI